MVDGDVALRAELVDQLLHRDRGDDFVGFALDDDSRGRARSEESEVVHVGGRGDRDEALDLGAAHQQLHSDPGTEADPRHPGSLGLGVNRLDPIERRGGVAEFADAIVERPLAFPYAAKVEPQRCEAAAHEGLVKQLHDLVVHRAAGLRVAMEDHRHRRARTRPGIEAAFETAFGTRKNDFGHGASCSRLTIGGRAGRWPAPADPI